jgi:uncharacterized RDD family membrane protein YckC
MDPTQPTPPTQATPPTPPAAPPGQTPTWSAPVEPTGPAPGYQFAPHGGRLIAYIVDVVIVTAVLIVMWMFVAIGAAFLGAADSSGATGILGVLLVVFIILTFLISIGYFPFFWARGGQTPGMRAFHLRVVRDRDGGPIGGGTAILRLIGYWISGAVFYLGFIWILIDSRRRGWHDLIAGTVVVETER